MGDKKAPRPRRSPLWRFLLGLSAVSAATLIYAYHAQPDELAGLTAVPASLWLVPAILSLLWFSGRGYKLFSLTVLALWVLFTATTVEEIRSLARRDKPPTSTLLAARSESRALRIVTLNCNVGQPQCAAEVKTLDPIPDIVLFQESPSQEELQKLAGELYEGNGGVLWSSDASIIARGKVEAKRNDGSSPFVHATVTLPDGQQVEAISVRLLPPVVRYDFWSKDFWKAYRTARRDRRKQVESLMTYVATIPATARLAVGGDMNCSAEDGALLTLRARLQDTFSPAGHGLCNTALNAYPLERVDQIWINEGLQAEWLIARKTENSDHRMVVCDVSMR